MGLKETMACRLHDHLSTSNQCGARQHSPTGRETILERVSLAIAVARKIDCSMGTEINSKHVQLCLPLQQLTKIPSILHIWQNKRKTTKQELLSLIVHVSFAANVVGAGRLSLQWLIDLNSTAHKLHHHTQLLNASARANIQWLDILPSTDASGVHG